MPFQAPAGHWISYFAPSGSDPVVVVTAFVPPQPWVTAAAVPTVAAVSPPVSKLAASAKPASFLVPSKVPTLPMCRSLRLDVTYR